MAFFTSTQILPMMATSSSPDESYVRLGYILVWEFYLYAPQDEISSRFLVDPISDINFLTSYIKFHENCSHYDIKNITFKLLRAALYSKSELLEKVINPLFDYFTKVNDKKVDLDEQWFEIILFCKQSNILKAVEFLKRLIRGIFNFPERYAFLHPWVFTFRDGDSPVHKFLNDPIELSELISCGFSVDLKNSQGETPLFVECSKKNPEQIIVNILVSNGANPNKSTNKKIDCFHKIFRNAVKPCYLFPIIKFFLHFDHNPEHLGSLKGKQCVSLETIPERYLEMGRQLLTAGETFCTTLDWFDDHVIYGNIGLTQGHPNFRIRASLVDARVFHPFVFSKFQHLNPSTYETLITKYFAHCLSLKMQPEDKRYEGFCESFTFPMYASAINYLKNIGGVFDRRDWNWVYTKLNEAVLFDRIESKGRAKDRAIDEVVQKYRTLGYDDIITLGSGYNWHFLGWFFWGDFAIYINRQRKSEAAENIIIYYVSRKEYFNSDFVKLMVNRFNQNETTYPKLKYVITRLGLVHITDWNVKNQKTGNCTLANTKGISLVILCIRYLMKTFTCNTQLLMKAEPWQHAYHGSRPSYKLLTQQSRENSAELIFQEVDRLVDKKDLNSEDLKYANSYYTVLIYAALSFSHLGLDFPIVKRLSSETRRSIWSRIIKLVPLIRAS